MKKIETLITIKLAFLFVVFCNAFVDVAHKILLQNIVFKVLDGPNQVAWISVINLLIIIPFLLLFTFSGYLSDKYNKKDILVYGALSSLFLSILIIFAYFSNNFYFTMFCLFLLAVQSAIYSPAKFGIILDIYGKKYLSKGNAHLQAVSIIAILFAIGITSYIFENFYLANNLEILTTKEELLNAIKPLTFYILPVAILEFLISFIFLRRVVTNYNFNKNLKLDKKEFFKGKLLLKNIKSIKSSEVIFLSVVGLSVFWGVSQGVLAVFPSYAKEYLNITDVFVINGVLAASGVGIALGSIFYARFSKHYIELGTIPLASLAMSITLYISTIVQSASMLILTFAFFGFFGGLFIVPLNSLIQFNAKKSELGTILAGNNWFHSLAMFLMLILTTIVAFFNLDSLNTLYIILLIISFGTLYTVVKLPQSFILIFLKFVVGLRYKLEIEGIKNIPNNRGTLFLGNHISWIDWAIILMAVPKEIRFVIYKPIYEKWYLNWLFRLIKAVPISNTSSKSSMIKIANELDNGNSIVLFPEGSISLNGHLGEFKRGFEKILEFTKRDVVVVPFYIRGLWESMFSKANQKFKNSKKTNSVTVCFAKSLKKEFATAKRVKEEVFLLSNIAWQRHLEELKPLNETIFDSLKLQASNVVFDDSTNTKLTGNRFLTASILFKNLLKKSIKKEQNIALLLPSSSIGAVINYVVLMQGKTVININYTSSLNQINASIKSANIKTIITSKLFLTKLKAKGFYFEEVFSGLNIIYLEDLKEKISKTKAVLTLLSVKFLPKTVLRTIHLKKIEKNSTVLILFSSGSEGIPKAIELSSNNILGNVQQISNILNVNEDDVILGTLPLFHAFGIVVTTFLPLIEGIKCVAHPDPTDGFGVAKLTLNHKATIMCGTSTFFRLYTKNNKIHPLMFDSLRLVVAGAEKLREDVRFDFKKKFGKDILEGYGTSETSPVATCNLPDAISSDLDIQIGNKIGTVGMAIPGTSIKIVDPNSFKELEIGQEGMVLISGVQVMKGYLNDEERTKEVLKTIKNRVYYVTGDKGKLDNDGFLTIIDRYSRFAKIAGEMVSLGLIEEEISKLIDLKNEDEKDIDFVAIASEDEKKGEKIVLLVSNIDEQSLENLKQKILKSFTNNLMLPSVYKIIDNIPKLASGKKDYLVAKELYINL